MESELWSAKYNAVPNELLSKLLVSHPLYYPPLRSLVGLGFRVS